MGNFNKSSLDKGNNSTCQVMYLAKLWSFTVSGARLLCSVNEHTDIAFIYILNTTILILLA